MLFIISQTLKIEANEKGLKIAAITVGVIIILMFLLFAFQGKIADIVKTEATRMLNAQFDFKNLNISHVPQFSTGFCHISKISG